MEADLAVRLGRRRMGCAEGGLEKSCLHEVVIVAILTLCVALGHQPVLVVALNGTRVEVRLVNLTVQARLPDTP